MNKLVLITGGSASGKTFLAERLKEVFGDKVIYISQDSFYKPNGSPERNYDEPDAFDFDKQDKVLNDLINNIPAKLPIYDFTKHDVSGEKDIQPTKIIILEGLFAFYGKMAEKADFKIFVNTPSDTRIARRITRDVKERGRSIDSVIDRWMQDVQPSYKKYISSQKHNADIVVPWIKINDKSIHSLATTIAYLDKDLKDF